MKIQTRGSRSGHRYLIVLLILLILTGCSRNTQGRSSKRKNRDSDLSDEVRDVSDSLDPIMSGSSFLEADVEEKAEMLEEVFEQMYDEGIIDDYSWDEEHLIYEFTFQDGTLGGVSLQKYDDRLDLALQAAPVSDMITASAIANERDISAMVLNGFENTAFRREFYEDLSVEWKQAGVDCSVDTYVTLNDLRDLKGYDLIVFAMHGGMRAGEVAIIPNEEVSKSTDRQFRDELDRKHVARVLGSDEKWHYWVFSGFFRDVYDAGDLQGKFIYVQPCMFFGCDCRGFVDYSYARTFVDHLGARALVGYHNSVESNYGRDVMNSTCMYMFGGYTVSQALSQAVYKYGSDDGWQDVAMDKYKAYPIICGDPDARLVKASWNDPGQFLSNLEGCWFDVYNNEFICFIAGENMQESGPYLTNYYGGKMASDVLEYGYITECVIDENDQSARIVAYFDGYFDYMEGIYKNEPYELVRYIDYSDFESQGMLHCSFDNSDLVLDLKYYGPFSDETWQKMLDALY